MVLDENHSVRPAVAVSAHGGDSTDDRGRSATPDSGGQEYGTDLADSIVALEPGAKVLIYSGAPDRETRERVSRSRAAGIAHKSGDVTELSRAIRTVASGRAAPVAARE